VTWTPSDPWPSNTPGGTRGADPTAPYAWGAYQKVWVLAEIASGNPWTMGPHPFDRLDAGNVLIDAGDMAGGGPTPPGTLPPVDGLWVDLSCDLIDLEIRGGAGNVQGVRSQTEAGTLTATLYDPTGKYDPLNPDTPFQIGGRSRLQAGTRVMAFCETIVDPTAATPTVATRYLFGGTADVWAEEWTKEPSDRRCQLIATDIVKDLNKMDRPEQPPVGGGDDVFTRLNRIAAYFGFPGPTGLGEFTDRTLQATTLAQPAWEQLNRAVTDDLGFLYVAPYPTGGLLVYISSLMWQDGVADPPLITVGCDDPAAFDIVTGARPASLDAYLTNHVTAARAGGVEQVADNPTSVDTYGTKDYKRTDLGLETDAWAADWATTLVALSAYPRHAVDRITLQPAVAPDAWLAFRRVLQVTPVVSRIRLLFQTPLVPYTLDLTVRMVGWTHRVNAWTWQTEWRTTAASMGAGGRPWTMGPHAFDALDAGNVLI